MPFASLEETLQAEEARRKRCARLRQVRVQEAKHAASLAESVRRQKQSLERKQLREAAMLEEVQREEQRRALEELYLLSMKAFGRGHEAARELAAQHHSNNAGKLSSEEEDLANIRHKKALTRLRTERNLAEKDQKEHAHNREKALATEKRRADRIRKQREKKGSARNASRKGIITAGSTRNRARDADLARYATSHHHRDAPLVAMAVNAVSRARRDGEDANAAAACEEQRNAKELASKEARQRELAAKTESRGRKAANLVRLDKVKKEAERELGALSRRDYDHRKSVRAHPAIPVVETHRQAEKAARRQQKLEQAFEALYYDAAGPDTNPLAAEPPRVRLVAAEPVESDDNCISDVDSHLRHVSDSLDAHALPQATVERSEPAHKFEKMSQPVHFESREYPQVYGSETVQSVGDSHVPHHHTVTRHHAMPSQRASLRGKSSAPTTISQDHGVVSTSPAQAGVDLQYIARKHGQTDRRQTTEKPDDAAALRAYLHEAIVKPTIPSGHFKQTESSTSTRHDSEGVACDDNSTFFRPYKTPAQPQSTVQRESEHDIPEVLWEKLLFNTQPESPASDGTLVEQRLSVSPREKAADSTPIPQLKELLHEAPEHTNAVLLSDDTHQPLEVKSRNTFSNNRHHHTPEEPMWVAPARSRLPLTAATFAQSDHAPQLETHNDCHHDVAPSYLGFSSRRPNGEPNGDIDLHFSYRTTTPSRPSENQVASKGASPLESLKARLAQLHASQTASTVIPDVSSTTTLHSEHEPYNHVQSDSVTNLTDAHQFLTETSSQAESSKDETGMHGDHDGDVDTSEFEETIPTALYSLVKQGALYVGHPTVVRTPPKLSPVRLENMGALNEPVQADARQFDYGAKDDWVSRLSEKHDHQDLHDLLPPTKPFGDGEADPPSLQDAFRRHNQRFIANSKARIEAVAQAKERGKTSGHDQRRQAFIPRTPPPAQQELGVEAGPVQPPGRLDVPDNLRRERRRMKKNEIVSLNQRLYTRLCPEVRKAKEAKEKTEEYARNREKQKLYAEKIRLRQQTRSHQT